MEIEHSETSPQSQREFFAWDVDPESGLVKCETYCGLASADTISKLLSVSFSYKNPSEIIYIDESHVEKLEKFFSISLDYQPDKEMCLCSWSPLDNLPYRLHTRRELILMASGIKPLCSLVGRLPPDESFEEIPEYLFDPYVENGKLIKREYCEINDVKSSPYPGLRVVLYASVEESWRLDAYIQVRLTAKKFGWSESLTYQEGSLLGYSEPENDAWISALRRQQNK